MNWDILLYLLSALIIAAGLIGTIVPALPGVPLMFAGMLLAAWTGGFDPIGPWTLGVLGLLTALAVAADLLASLLGAKRVGASAWALFGAAVGTLVGLFFGLLGILVGPFVGALAGELIAGGTLQRAGTVGVGTWIGFLLGTVVKIALACVMLGLFLLRLLLG
jgi:uncharacterized protein YqgC (DUF456 family)